MIKDVFLATDKIIKNISACWEKFIWLTLRKPFQVDRYTKFLELNFEDEEEHKSFWLAEAKIAESFLPWIKLTSPDRIDSNLVLLVNRLNTFTASSQE